MQWSELPRKTGKWRRSLKKGYRMPGTGILLGCVWGVCTPSEALGTAVCWCTCIVFLGWESKASFEIIRKVWDRPGKRWTLWNIRDANTMNCDTENETLRSLINMQRHTHARPGFLPPLSVAHFWKHAGRTLQWERCQVEHVPWIFFSFFA